MSIVYDGTIGAFRQVATLSNIQDIVFVRLASTISLGATYNAGAKTLTATANGALALDQVTAVITNRVLIKNQDDRTQNGIYDVTDPGGESTPFVLTRSSDMASSEDLAQRPCIVVTEGVANSSVGLQLLNTGDIELGVTGLRFTQFTGGLAGVSADALDAIDGASTPSASNVFATMTDLVGAAASVEKTGSFACSYEGGFEYVALGTLTGFVANAVYRVEYCEVNVTFDPSHAFTGLRCLCSPTNVFSTFDTCAILYGLFNVDMTLSAMSTPGTVLPGNVYVGPRTGSNGSNNMYLSSALVVAGPDGNLYFKFLGGCNGNTSGDTVNYYFKFTKVS